MEETLLTFAHPDNKKNYEVRRRDIVINGLPYHEILAVDEDGNPANGYSYIVKKFTAHEALKTPGYDFVQDLAESAKHDVINGTYEKYLKAIAQQGQGQSK